MGPGWNEGPTRGKERCWCRESRSIHNNARLPFFPFVSQSLNRYLVPPSLSFSLRIFNKTMTGSMTKRVGKEREREGRFGGRKSFAGRGGEATRAATKRYRCRESRSISNIADCPFSPSCRAPSDLPPRSHGYFMYRACVPLYILNKTARQTKRGAASGG